MAFIERDPLLPLQGAMYARLKNDAELTALKVRIFDRVSEDYFPRIVIGEDVAVPEETDCYSGGEVFSTVRVYTDSVGKVECKKILRRIRYLLTMASGFTVDGFEMSIGHCTDVKAMDHEDRLRVQGVSNFTYRLIAV